MDRQALSVITYWLNRAAEAFVCVLIYLILRICLIAVILFVILGVTISVLLSPFFKVIERFSGAA